MAPKRRIVDTSQDYGAPLSNVPPLAWLSGLNLGQTGMSGAPDASMGGMGPGGGMPGMEGGLGLDALTELLQQQQGTNVGGVPGGAASMLQGIGGSIGQGTLAQGGQGYAIAGQGGQGGYTAGQTQAGGIDPMAIIRQALGVAQKGIGAAQKAGGQSDQGYATAGQSADTEPGQINPAGYSLTGPGAPAEGSPEGLAQFFQGQFGGQDLLNDPTLTELLTRGVLTGSLTPADLGDLSTLGGDQLAGLRTALTTGDVQSDLGTQLLSGGTGGFSLGGGNATGGATAPTNWGGAAAGGVGSLLGLLNLYQSAQGGNIPGAVGGGLGTVGGLAQLLASSPGLAQALGLSQGALTGTNAALGGLSSLLGIGTGASQIAEGNPLGAIPVVQGAYAGLTATPAIYSALSGVSQQAIQAGQSALGALGPALQTAGAYAPAVLAVAQALYDSLSLMEETAKLKSGALNNPIKGQLYSQATEGVGNANQILQQLASSGGPGTASTESLMGALGPLANSLLPYYQTAQGGVKALRASETAGSPGAQTKDVYTENFTQAKQGLEGILHELLGRGVSYEDIGALQGINPAWASMSLDASGRPEEFYARGKNEYAKTAPGAAGMLQSQQIVSRGQNVDPSAPNYEAPTAWDEAPRYQPEYFVKPPTGMLQPGEQGYEANVGSQSFTPWMYAGGQNIAGLGSPLSMASLTPENQFIAALGAAGYDPNALTPEQQMRGKSGVPDVAAQQGVASMYGGPIWQALARMGSADFSPLIQQHFNPWATWGGMSPEQRLTAMGPSVLGPTSMARDAGVFASDGVVENPRIADFFAGLTPNVLGTYTPRYAPGSRAPQPPPLPTPAPAESMGLLPTLPGSAMLPPGYGGQEDLMALLPFLAQYGAR